MTAYKSKTLIHPESSVPASVRDILSIMRIIPSLARIFFSIAIVAFGIQHLIYGEFVTRVVPKFPPWIPYHSVLAYLTGIVLIALGLSLHKKKAALALAALIFLSFVLLYIPLLLKSPFLGGMWTNAGKALALTGGALMIAQTGRPIARAFLASFLILGGVQHFLYPGFVATLVPVWIPNHLFWTYFAGVALIAGGVGILIAKVRQPAGLLTGIMILLWVVMLHIPRALVDLHNSNETTAVFEALAIGGTALLAAQRGK